MEVTLAAQSGRASGSREARRLRRTGLVPAVLYGQGIEAIPVAVDHRELMAALHTDAGVNAIISLEVGDGATYTTLAREIQRHPFKPRIDHLDFIQISLTETVEAEVSIDFVGEPVGVKENGGIVTGINVTVRIEALPTEIPSSIEVDISHLDVHDTLTLEDLPAISGVTYLDPGDMPIVSITLPAAEVEEEPEEGEEIEGEEGEEIEGEEGEEAPAASDEEAGGDE